VAEELFTCPPDLTLVSDGDLSALQTRATAEFDRVHGLDDPSAKDMSYAITLAQDLDKIKAELKVRDVRAAENARLSKDSISQTMARLNEQVHGEQEVRPEQSTGMDADAIAAAAAKGVTEGLMAVFADRRGGSLDTTARQVASLRETARRAPDPKVPEAQPAVVVAAVDIPDRQVHSGGTIPDIEALADAFITRAKSLPATHVGQASPRHMVASVRNNFDHVIDDRTPVSDVERLFKELTSGERQRALVAGGGWCAPSELRYELFNIADAPSGTIDLPTVGVSRGGIRFPTSPSIADSFFTAGGSNAASGMGGFKYAFSNATDPWLWSETDDILTVTGSVNKPTLRVPCAAFNDVRLEAYGLTLTAGNLTDSAYPEATQNFLRLLRAAYAHAINARLIGLMATASTVTAAIGAASMPAFQTLLDGVEMGAVDYRARFGMSDEAVLEVVMPSWARALIRADLAWRVYGDSSLLSVSNQQLMSYFADRGVRIQFVSDWQVRTSGKPGDPATPVLAQQTSVQFMMYAAGTFIHGTGLTLDLGIVRDSVLNSENDFTAAWAEEAHLIAKVGHESRLYTATLAVNGTGALGQAANGTYV
jgi:hypothetical protein